MPAVSDVKMVILFEDELRKASRLLDQLFMLPEDASDDVFQTAARAAIQACRVALYHPALLEDASIVMMTARGAFPRIESCNFGTN